MTHSPAIAEDRAGRVVLAATLTAGTALRLWLAWTEHGIYWPDEIYMSLEQAHRLVFGYGFFAWEFIEGARHWTLAGLIAAVLWLCSILGFDHPAQYLGIVRSVLAICGASAIYGTYRLARAYGAAPLSAAGGAALFGLAAPAIYFAHRGLGESAAVAPIVFGYALALRPGAARGPRALGVSLVALSVLIRIQCGVFCVALLAIFLGRRQRRAFLEALAVLTAWALVFGLVDRLTWGRWFQSAIVYVHYTFVEGKASKWGTAPFGYYAEVLWRSTPVPWLWMPLALLAARRAPGLLVAALGFFLLHSAIPHKEFRFLVPALPLLAALAGIGLDLLQPLRLRWAAAALLLGGAAVSAASFRQLTFGGLGQSRFMRPEESAYDYNGPTNRLLLAAHERPDLCGLRVDEALLAFTGGYTYLHRNVPLYHRGRPSNRTGPSGRSGYFNYRIARVERELQGEIVTTDQDLALVRVRDGCVSDPSFSWRLPGA